MSLCVAERRENGVKVFNSYSSVREAPAMEEARREVHSASPFPLQASDLHGCFHLGLTTRICFLSLAKGETPDEECHLICCSERKRTFQNGKRGEISWQERGTLGYLTEPGFVVGNSVVEIKSLWTMSFLVGNANISLSSF